MTSGQQLGLSITALIFGIVIFAAAFISLHLKKELFGLNVPVLDWLLAHRNAAYTNALKLITNMFDPVNFVIVVAFVVIVWAIVKREVYRPLILTGSLGVALVSATLVKEITKNARPPHIDMIKPFETGFSFPSIHTIAATVFFLVFFYLIYSRKFSGLKFWLLNIFSIIAVAVVALSRLYLGYHWLTDVVAAFGLGLIVFGLIIFIDKFLSAKFGLNESQ